jgi:hypothetical protein
MSPVHSSASTQLTPSSPHSLTRLTPQELKVGSNICFYSGCAYSGNLIDPVAGFYRVRAVDYWGRAGEYSLVAEYSASFWKRTLLLFINMVLIKCGLSQCFRFSQSWRISARGLRLQGVNDPASRKQLLFCPPLTWIMTVFPQNICHQICTWINDDIRLLTIPIKPYNKNIQNVLIQLNWKLHVLHNKYYCWSKSGQVQNNTIMCWHNLVTKYV